MNIAVFPTRPNSRAVCAFLGRTVGRAEASPRYIVCDRDSIFDCDAFRRWAKRKKIKLRYGAVGKHGSIAVVERMIKTVKVECTRRIFIPVRRNDFRRETVSFVDWYNEHRPHMTLEGRTPNEVYFDRRPANRKPRIEPRPRWPRRSRCARPQALVAGKSGERFDMTVSFHAKRRHLPIVTLKRAA
jgi:hypothetical protein